MPRTTKLQRRTEAALAALPFAPSHAADAPERYENLPDDVREAVAVAVYRAFRIEGRSGADCRAIFGGTDDATDGVNVGLSGPRRRRVFAEFPNLADGVAKSYEAYADGEPRKGSAHARQHGTLAIERQAALAAKLAADEAAAAKRAARNAKAKARREARKLAASAPVAQDAQDARTDA